MNPPPGGELYRQLPVRPLVSPVLVTALEGWVDAGFGAQQALATMLDASEPEPAATFDEGPLLDRRARRPVARIVDGITTELTWPRIELRAGADQRGADVLFLVGPEPDFLWREFVDAVVALARGWGVRMAVALGAFPAPAPHTRPVRLAATAPPGSADLVRRIGAVQGDIQVPAGLQFPLELAFEHAGVPVVSLWARVPHYVSAMAFPAAGAALVEGVMALTGLQFDVSALTRADDEVRRKVDRLVSGNPEHRAMVAKLEEAIDASEGNPLGVTELPTGEELAAELEQFLRGENQ
ncbi:MAG TPA: PAC2 family protein [Acidimicrobiales bacterium]|nr:PAC2 family protein [Acidimicrobiales bacterium]